MTKLTKDARERPQVIIDRYQKLWGELLGRAHAPKAGDVDLLHSCMMVLGKSYEDFDAQVACRASMEDSPSAGNRRHNLKTKGRQT